VAGCLPAVSLADSPDAFRTTLAESKDQPEEFWRGAVASTVQHERANLWIALNGDDPLGKLFVRIDVDRRPFWAVDNC
jgi:hypothetical protein